MPLSHAVWSRLGRFLKTPQGNVREHRLRILNETRGTVLATRAELADTAPARSKGLLGRRGLDTGEALWIVPCESVHTFGMQFALDLVYLDRRHRIVKIRTNVPPWRLSACLRAHSILEFAAGAVTSDLAGVGDQLAFEAASEESSANLASAH